MAIDYNLLVDQFRLYFLVFVRITAMVVSAPVLGNAVLQVPPQLIAGLGSALRLVVMMNLDPQTALPPVGWVYGMMVVGEAILGISIRFFAGVVLVGDPFGGLGGGP